MVANIILICMYTYIPINNNRCDHYSRAETNQGRKLLIIRRFWPRKLFKGGNYSRVETIRGNTVFEKYNRYRTQFSIFVKTCDEHYVQETKKILIKLTYSVRWYWNNTESPINILDKTFDPMWIRYPIGKFMNIFPNSFMFCVKNMGTIFADTNTMLVNVVITIATNIRVLSRSEFQVGYL